MPTQHDGGGMRELFDAIKSLSGPLATSNEGYAPEQFSGLDRVALSLKGTTQQLQTRFETMLAQDKVTIRTAEETTAKLTSRIESLETAEQRKSAQIESQSRRISELEDVLATKDNALEEKNDTIVATRQELQEMTDECESLKQQLRKRPATPISSNRTRPQPHSPLAVTFQLPDDAVDYEPEGDQEEDEQSEQHQQDDYEEQQPDDDLSGPTSPSSSTSRSEEDMIPVVEHDLEQLEVGLKIVAYNSESRLVYQRCPEGLLRSVILGQLADFRAAHGADYIGHLSERKGHRDYEPNAWRCMAENPHDRFEILD
ncbi:hypothetical protein KC336_g5751 [Hortaea werneckii]|nr:hypothetical protein KC336_g5751 [Hortaea werneckii]